MKKIVLVPLLLGVMSLGGVIAVAGGNIIGSANNANVLPKADIEKKALDTINGTITELEFENEGPRSYYEVEVKTNDAEYDLIFDALTGELLKQQKSSFVKHNIHTTTQNSHTKESRDDLTDSSTVNTKQQTITNPTVPTQAPTNPSKNNINRYDDDHFDDDWDDRYDDNDHFDDDWDDRYDDDDHFDDDRYEDDDNVWDDNDDNDDRYDD